MAKSLTTNQMVKLFASILGGNGCERCDALTHNPENEYGEFICDDCEQNAAEASWERRCEDYYGGSWPKDLQQQQIEALRLK